MPRRRPHLTFGTVLSHLGVIVAVSAVLGVLVAGLAIPFVGAVGYSAKATDRSMQNLPAELKTTPLAQRTRVLARNGKLIATFYDENRVNVPLSKVAPVMRRAIIAIEDYRFYEHGALDLKGTLRAFVSNQTSDSGTQGGSSITQQMAKMTQLTQARTEEERKAATENTYQRKIQELRHAIAFEQNYSKNWILERYLNLAYFGDGAYGVQAAARHYFSVNASQLDTNQAATLAGLVKNPVGFDPTTYRDRAIARRNVVLNRMAELGMLEPAVATRLISRPLDLRVSTSRNGCLGTKAPFFCDYLRRYLMADKSLGKTAADRAQLINGGGLTIRTTVDLGYQRAADAATAASVRPRDQAIGALAMVQPRTGDVHGRLPVATHGSRAQGRGDLPQLRRGQQVRRLQRVPGRIDVQGVRARRRPRAGAADLDEVQRAGAGEHPAERVPGLRRALPGELALVAEQLDEQRKLRHVQGHPALGEHLLRPARAPHRPV